MLKIQHLRLLPKNEKCRLSDLNKVHYSTIRLPHAIKIGQCSKEVGDQEPTAKSGLAVNN